MIKLICVTANNNNKYYYMEDLDPEEAERTLRYLGLK